ncbi:MAG: beta-lactamase regulating signal transducer with metallopeptidase domain [Akkermansiaceae bacterium]|jgi:beta-lactamase regulating signal transducer with metallopeptidase domain
MIVNLINQHADRFMQIGLHFLWQGTALAILAALVSRFICKNPRQRATIYLGALFALSLSVPVILMTVANPSPQIIPAALSSSPSPEMTPLSTTLASNSPAMVTAGQSPFPLSSWITGIYLTGLLLMMARVLRGYLWSSKIRRNSQPVHEGHWPDALAQAVTTMKLRTKPAMIWSKNITSPVVTGILRPMIVLPVSLMSGLPQEQAIAVLSHELAHLRRCDHLIIVFQRLLEALFFFHPAVWFLSRRLDQEREKACDDLVVKAGHNRADYAEALVNIASDQRATLALAAAQNNQLKERIFRILNHPQPTTVQVNRNGWLTIAAAIAALGFFSLSPALSEEKEVAEAEKSEETETGRAAILKKLESQIPEINFQNTPLVKAVEWLRMRSIELDQSGNGINWVVRKLVDDDPAKIRIDSLVGKNLTFKEVLEAICEKTRTRYKVDEYAVTIVRQLAPGEEEFLVDQRTWNTPPDFPTLVAASGISPRSKTIVKHLEALGVEFPNGASASYLATSSKLIVQNTPKNLEMIDAIVKATSDPKTAEAQRARAKSSEAERVVSEAHDKLLELKQREWTTTPDFLDRIALTEGFKPSSTEECLKIHGITFLGNSGASFLSKSNILIVRNTQANLELIDALVKAAEDPEFGKKREEAIAAAKKNLQELQKIIIPEIQLQGATLAGAVEFLRVRSIELDPTKKGVKINIFSDDKDLSQIEIKELRLVNVPVTVVLQYICDTTRTRYKIEGRAISILPGKE